MRHIEIVSVGKSKETWLKLALEEYEKRLKPDVTIVWRLFSKEKEFEKALLLEKKEYVALDPNGASLTSETFSDLILGTSSLTFVIGGPEGLTPEMKKKAKMLISLSSLTFTHQHTRIILLEQIYRSIQIGKGSDYHK